MEQNDIIMGIEVWGFTTGFQSPTGEYYEMIYFDETQIQCFSTGF